MDILKTMQPNLWLSGRNQYYFRCFEKLTDFLISACFPTCFCARVGYHIRNEMVDITLGVDQKPNLMAPLRKKHPRNGAILMQNIANQTEHAITVTFQMNMVSLTYRSDGACAFTS